MPLTAEECSKRIILALEPELRASLCEYLTERAEEEGILDSLKGKNITQSAKILAPMIAMVAEDILWDGNTGTAREFREGEYTIPLDAPLMTQLATHDVYKPDLLFHRLIKNHEGVEYLDMSKTLQLKSRYPANGAERSI